MTLARARAKALTAVGCSFLVAYAVIAGLGILATGLLLYVALSMECTL